MDSKGVSPAPLTLTRTDTGAGKVRLDVAGEADVSNVDRLRDAVTEIIHLPGATELVLDLERLDFIDSLGARALMMAKNLAERQQVRFSVINARGSVLRVLTVLGMYELLSADDRRTGEADSSSSARG
jgi:anti-sigma B factor antagonist